MADENQNAEGVDERPEWLPEQFTDGAALAKSYDESRRELNRLQTEVRAQQQAFEEQLEQLQAVQAQQTQQQQSPGYDDERWRVAWDEDPIRTAAYLSQQVAEQTAQRILQQTQQPMNQQAAVQQELVVRYAQQTMDARYEDWGEYQDRVAAAIREDEGLVPNTALTSPELAARSLERVYKMVKADEVLKSHNATAAQAATAHQQKLAAQTMGGSSSGSRAVSGDDYHDRALTIHKGSSPYGSL